ncbi:MAG: signal peptidase I [Actinomycetota bacterium]|nr:signal peptidase I [Actinomycetota bacterium]
MRTRRGLVALTVAMAVLGIAGLRGRLRRYEIVEASMEPQLYSGDYIIAKVVNDVLQRGDIVIVAHPEIDGFELAKRVVGLPGELIALRNGQVDIGGAVLAEPWADGPVHPAGEWQLDDHEIFVLGDNRSVSAADSRTIGPIDTDRVMWKAIARYWPLGRIGRIATTVSPR